MDMKWEHIKDYIETSLCRSNELAVNEPEKKSLHERDAKIFGDILNTMKNLESR